MAYEDALDQAAELEQIYHVTLASQNQDSAQQIQEMTMGLPGSSQVWPLGRHCG